MSGLFCIFLLNVEFYSECVLSILGLIKKIEKLL